MSECKTCGPKDKSGLLAVNLKWREECVSTPGHEKCANCFKVPTENELSEYPWWFKWEITSMDKVVGSLLLCHECYKDPKNRFLTRYKDHLSHPRYQQMYASEEKPQGV